ncbi:MAG: hypothetical protein HY559_02750 [Gammaproteobacteria bacterium]|nr:hypothetical protein [Gammaproteobacteria bacterium]
MLFSGMRNAITQLYQRNPARVISRGVTLLALIGLLAIAIQVFLNWQKLVKEEDLPPPTPISEVTPEAPEEETVEVQQLADWHLFGKAGVSIDKLTGQEIDPSQIPITALQLVLKGVLASGGKGKGSAIISDKEKLDRFYVVGATMPGPAILRAVYPDRVLLEYRARLETLWLESPETPKPAGAEGEREGRFMGTSPGWEDEDEEEYEYEEEEE